MIRYDRFIFPWSGVPTASWSGVFGNFDAQFPAPWLAEGLTYRKWVNKRKRTEAAVAQKNAALVRRIARIK